MGKKKLEQKLCMPWYLFSKRTLYKKEKRKIPMGKKYQ